MSVDCNQLISFIWNNLDNSTKLLSVFVLMFLFLTHIPQCPIVLVTLAQKSIETVKSCELP